MSKLRRFFVEDQLQTCSTITITGNQFNHAINTLRLSLNDQIILSCNDDYDYTATIFDITKKQFSATVTDKTPNDCNPKTHITLISGYLKGDNSQLVCQKAVELGVSQIVLFDSQFSSGFISQNKLEKLITITKEACKQCGRSKYPQISYAKTFDIALQDTSHYTNKIFACEFKTENSTSLNQIEQGKTAIIVGSEGGFSQAEAQLAFDKGFQTISLGNRILRAETANIALLAIISHQLGQLN